MLPSAVNVSTLLSEISNVGKLFATRFPKITSEDDGAAAKTIIEPFASIRPLLRWPHSQVKFAAKKRRKSHEDSPATDITMSIIFVQ